MDPQVFKDALPEIFTQLLGFLVVFFVLKQFAFKAILGIVDARAKKIGDEFSAIEKQKKDLETLEKDYRKRLDQIEQEARVKIQQAADQGTALSRDIQDRARADVQKMVERAKDEIEQDLKRARLSMRNEIVEISSLITERVLAEKLEPKDHEKLVDRFLKELESIR